MLCNRMDQILIMETVILLTDLQTSLSQCQSMHHMTDMEGELPLFVHYVKLA